MIHEEYAYMLKEKLALLGSEWESRDVSLANTIQTAAYTLKPSDHQQKKVLLTSQAKPMTIFSPNFILSYHSLPTNIYYSFFKFKNYVVSIVHRF